MLVYMCVYIYVYVHMYVCMYVSNQTILDPIDFHSTTKERNVKKN